MEDKLQILHSNLVKEGYDVPDYGTFKTDMSDPLKSKKLHDNLVGAGYELPDYDTFLGDMGLVKKKFFSVLDSLTPASGKEEMPFLDALGKPLTPQQPLPSAEKPRETTVIGDLARTLKSTSLRALGGVMETPMLISNTVHSLVSKPIIKAMGGTDEDAQQFADYTRSLNTFGQTVQAGEDSQKILNREATKAEAKMQAIEGNIAQNIQQKNWGAAAELLGRGVVGSIPYLALTAATAGGGTAAVLGTIGATSAAQQYGELEGVAEPKRLLNSWMYGGFEAAGELITAGLLRGIGKSFRLGKNLDPGIIQKVDPEAVKGFAKGLLKSFGLESSSEAVTQVGQNFTDIVTGIDPKRNIFDGVLDAAMIGGISGGGIGAVNIAASMLGRAMASPQEEQKVQNNAVQQKVLIDQIEQTDSDPVKNALKRSIKDLRVQSDEVMDANYELATKLSPEKRAQVAELYSVWNELQAKIDNKEVTEHEVPAIENTIKGIKDQIQGIKDKLVTQLEEEAKTKETTTEKSTQPTEPAKAEYKIGDQSFKSEKELTDWLDKNYNERDRFGGVNEEGYIEPNTMRVFNKWYKENKERLAQEDLAREEEKAKQLQAIEDLKAAERTDEPVGTMTKLETKDGLDWYNVVNEEGQRDTFSVPEGSPQDVVKAESEKLVKPQEIKPVKFYDALKKNNAPRVQVQDEFGNERVVWDVNRSDYMDTSDETGRKIRWGVELSDGRVVSLDGLIRITQPEVWAKYENKIKGMKLESKNEFIIKNTLGEEEFAQLYKETIDFLETQDVYSQTYRGRDDKTGEKKYSTDVNPQKVNKLLQDEGHPLAGIFSRDLKLKDGNTVNAYQRWMFDLDQGKRSVSPKVESAQSKEQVKPKIETGGNQNAEGIGTQITEGSQQPQGVVEGEESSLRVRNNEASGKLEAEAGKRIVPIEKMNSEQLRQYAREEKQRRKEQEDTFFGKENASKYREAQSISEGFTATTEQRKAAYETINALEKSLTKEQYDAMFGENYLDPADIRDIAQRVELVEQAETVNDLGGALKIPLLDFAKNKDDKGALAVLNAARNKSEELGVNPKEMLASAINRIAKDLPDTEDAILLADDILKKIMVSTEPLIEELPKESSVVAETATQLQVEGNVPPPPESGQIPPIESEIQGEKPLGAQERSLNQIETEQQQILSDIINENKGFYNTLHGEQAVKNANKFIEDRGIDAATRELEQPTKDINEYPTRQVARMVLIDHYTRILGSTIATKEQKNNAYTATNNLQQRISIEANKTGQGNAHLNLWKVMQPAGLLEFTKRHIAEFNDKKLKRKIGDKSIGQLLDLVYKQLSEANKEIIDDILAGKEIEAKMPVEKPNVKREPAKKKTVPKEQVKAEKDYRKKLLDDYRKSQGKVTLQAGIPLTAEQIELGGNLIASYIREGYYRAVDIINKLIDDLKAIGLNVTEDDLDPILSTKKEGNQTFRSWMREQEASVGLTEEMKSLKLRISDIVKMHWSKRDELGRTLAQKLVDDAGLSETEAKKLETAILDEYNKRIQDRLKSFKDLSILLGREKVPSDKKTKTRLDRLIELVNLGALEENVYRGLFAGKFGLAPEITEEQGRIIMQKASVVQQMTDKGWFYREAVKDLTKYLYELNPTSKFNEWAETWIALSYSNMLFGYFTTILNLWSSGSNILLKPLRDATNMSRWIRALKSGNPSGEVYMPGGEMYYMPMFQGIAHGITDAAEIYANGDVGSKYIEEITKSKQFRVGQLERDKFGKGKRFKPIKVGGVDLNIFNLNKYSGRNLAAQDRLMFNTIFEMEVASIIRRNLSNTQNLTGAALSSAVMDELQGAKVDKALLEKQIEAEAAKFKELTGQETTDRQRKIRMRELMVKQLPITEEERLDAERLAQGNIFTDTRGGIVATLANAIGMLSNSNPSLGVIVKPFIPFTKIVGNVTEYMLDHVPFYGFFRANGKSISLIKKKMNPEAMTAQMGEKGSNLYYEQMGRAWLGTLSFTVLAMMLLGNDDEDWVQISGGYNQEGFKQGGRENVMPKYTIRIGGVDISYLNIPAMAIPLGLIGNINDAIKMKMPSEEISNRLAATMLLEAVANTTLMTKDMSFVQGTQNLLTLITDALSMEEGGWKKAGQNMAKSYIGFALRPLPQNSALVQQTWKFFDPVSYSQKDVKSILAYSAGLQHFVNYPTIDQLGDEVRTYPGEALLPYTHWFNIKGNDARWRFLADNNAIPNKIQNTTTYVDTEDGVEKRTLEVKELHDYTKLAGKMFSDKLESYMNDAAKVSKRSGDIISEENYKGETETKTGVQVDVDKMWSDARKSARTALFRWYDFKKTNAKDWDLMLSTDAVKEPEMTAVEIEIGNEKVKLTKEQMVEYNQLAMERYHERIMRYLNSKERVKDDKARVQDNGKTRFENKTDDEWREAKSRAERQMKRQLRDEKTNSAK